jgi:shikimate 5-dehydrogenase
MLIEQAALAFARWTGIQPPRAALWQAAPAEYVLSATDLP